MKCTDVQLRLSDYLDGAVPGAQMHALAAHLAACAGCNKEFALLQQTHSAVAALRREKAPAELALRLRVALSQELSRQRSGSWQRLAFRVEDALNPLMFPATAGLLAAIVFFAVIIGFFALPTQLAASDDSFYTPPQLQSTSPFINAIPGEAAVVVDAEVDAQGRVQDYEIISAPPASRDILPELNNIMIFTTFRPATTFGQPTSGRVVLSFSRINVKG